MAGVHWGRASSAVSRCRCCPGRGRSDHTRGELLGAVAHRRLAAPRPPGVGLNKCSGPRAHSRGRQGATPHESGGIPRPPRVIVVSRRNGNGAVWGTSASNNRARVKRRPRPTRGASKECCRGHRGSIRVRRRAETLRRRRTRELRAACRLGAFEARPPLRTHVTVRQRRRQWKRWRNQRRVERITHWRGSRVPSSASGASTRCVHSRVQWHIVIRGGGRIVKGRRGRCRQLPGHGHLAFGGSSGRRARRKARGCDVGRRTVYAAKLINVARYLPSIEAGEAGFLGREARRKGSAAFNDATVALGRAESVARRGALQGKGLLCIDAQVPAPAK